MQVLMHLCMKSSWQDMFVNHSIVFRMASHFCVATEAKRVSVCRVCSFCTGYVQPLFRHK